MADEPSYDDLLVSSDPSAACLFVVDANENGVSFSPGLPPIASSAKSSTANGTKTIEVVINGVKRVITVPAQTEGPAVITSTQSSSSAASGNQNTQSVGNFTQSNASHRLLGNLVNSSSSSSFPFGSAAPSIAYRPNSTSLQSQPPRFGNVTLSQSDIFSQFRPRVGKPVTSTGDTSRYASTSNAFQVRSLSNGYGNLPAPGFYPPFNGSSASSSNYFANTNVLQNFTNQPWNSSNVNSSYGSVQLSHVQQVGSFQPYPVLQQGVLQPQSQIPSLGSGFSIHYQPQSINYQPLLAGNALRQTTGMVPVSNSQSFQTAYVGIPNCNASLQSNSASTQAMQLKQSNSIVWPNIMSNNQVEIIAPVGELMSVSYPHLSAAINPVTMRAASEVTVLNNVTNSKTMANGNFQRLGLMIRSPVVTADGARDSNTTVHHRPLSTRASCSGSQFGQSNARSSRPPTNSIRSSSLYGFRFGEGQSIRHSVQENSSQSNSAIALPSLPNKPQPHLQSRPEHKVESTTVAAVNNYNQFRIAATTNEAVPRSAESLIITVRTGTTPATQRSVATVAEAAQTRTAPAASLSCSASTLVSWFNGYTDSVTPFSTASVITSVNTSSPACSTDVHSSGNDASGCGQINCSQDFPISESQLLAFADMIQSSLSDTAVAERPSSKSAGDTTHTEKPQMDGVESHQQPIVHSPEKVIEALKLAKSIGKGMHHVEKTTARRKTVRQNRRKQCFSILQDDDSCTSSSDSWRPDDLQSHSSEKTPSSAFNTEDDSSNDSWLSHDSVDVRRSRKSNRFTKRNIRRTFFDTQSVRQTKGSQRSLRRRPEASENEKDDIRWSSMIKPCSVRLEVLNIGSRQLVNVFVAEQSLCCSNYSKAIRYSKRVIDSDDEHGVPVSRELARLRKRPRIDDLDYT